MAKRLEMVARVFPTGQHFTVYGRDAWALAELITAGAMGCTPITHPGPRWSAYVHALRHERGLDIETVTESHGGQFEGHHARYILRSKVEVLQRSDCSEMGVAA